MPMPPHPENREREQEYEARRGWAPFEYDPNYLLEPPDERTLESGDQHDQ